MKITDQMIDDVCTYFIRAKLGSKTASNHLKKYLKDKGYKVDETKTALEEAREFSMAAFPSRKWQPEFVTYHNDHVHTKIKLYEKAIEEEREKNKIEIPERLIEWLDYTTSDGPYSDRFCARALLKILKK